MNRKILYGAFGLTIFGACICLAVAVALVPLTAKNRPTNISADTDQSTEEVTDHAEVVSSSTDTPEPTSTDTPAFTETPVPSTETPIEEPTAAPTNTPVSTDTPEPTDTTSPTKPAGLPGLAQADVKLNMEDRGFTCSDLDSDEQDGVTYYFRDCTNEIGEVDLYVGTISRTITGVDAIEASIAFLDGQGDDQLAASFLGFVATMPYDGSQPTQARAWVESNITEVDTGKPEETEISGVKMMLVGPPTARILQMGEVD